MARKVAARKTGVVVELEPVAHVQSVDTLFPLPEELKDRDITRGESDLKGHIKGAEEGDQGSGSAAYVPPEAKDDIQLNYALDLLRGTKTDPAFPPNPQKAVLNQQQ